MDWRRQGVKPITSVTELGRPNRWESDDGYQASLADLCAFPPRWPGVSNVVVDTDVVLVILTLRLGAPRRDDEGVVHARDPPSVAEADRGAEQGHAAARTAAQGGDR